MVSLSVYTSITINIHFLSPSFIEKSVQPAILNNIQTSIIHSHHSHSCYHSQKMKQSFTLCELMKEKLLQLEKILGDINAEISYHDFLVNHTPDDNSYGQNDIIKYQNDLLKAVSLLELSFLNVDIIVQNIKDHVAMVKTHTLNDIHNVCDIQEQEKLKHLKYKQTEYWKMRDKLLKQYRGKYVAIVDGKVISVGADEETVLKDMMNKDMNDFYCEKVGEEEQINYVYKYRRT